MNKLKLAFISKFLTFDKNDKSHKGCKLVTLTSFSTILKMNTIKNTGSNLQHPHVRGHSTLGSLNQNEPGNAIDRNHKTQFL